MPTISMVASGFVQTALFTAKGRGMEGLPIFEVKGYVLDQSNVDEQVMTQGAQIEKALVSAPKVVV